MEDIDTEKLKEILEMMVDSGAVLLQYKDLLIQFPGAAVAPGDSTTQVIGFEAGEQAEPPDEVEERTRKPRPTGYTALFGDKRPMFQSPKASGRE